MFETAQRYVIVATWALWIGGLTFYGLVVVPTGTKLLGSTQQGFITQQVTNYLNLIGWVALTALLWNVVRQRRKLLAATWLVMLAAQIALMVIHPQLDKLLNPAELEVVDEARFHPLHEVYLSITGIQWTAALVHLAQSLWLWTRRPA
jgi:hypothetical protein